MAETRLLESPERLKEQVLRSMLLSELQAREQGQGEERLRAAEERIDELVAQAKRLYEARPVMTINDLICAIRAAVRGERHFSIDLRK